MGSQRFERTGRKRLLVLAVSACLCMGVGGWQTVHAQSITGGLYGSVPPGTHASVVVSSKDAGISRTVDIGKDGTYRVTNLAPGTYEVRIERDGQPPVRSQVVVSANRMSVVGGEAAAAAATASTPAIDATRLEAVHVTGQANQTTITPIDVTTTQLVNNYSMALVNNLPTARNPRSIALLSSDVRYDSESSGGIQMRGAGPSENRYYYNEFDTTNDYTGLGGIELPPEAIESSQTLTDADVTWTNTTGGILSATVRQGSNTFKAGYSVYFTPPYSRALEPRTHTSYNYEGNLYNYSDYSHQTTSYSQYLFASGPLIKDKLFLFTMLGNAPAHQSGSLSSNGITQTEASSRSKNALVNLTWNIADGHVANVIGYRNWGNSFNNTYNLNQSYQPWDGKTYKGWTQSLSKTQFLIGNYHGQLTENLGLQLMAGYTSNTSQSYAMGQGAPYVTQQLAYGKPSTRIGQGLSPNQSLPLEYWRRGFKGLFDWHLGDHTIKFGGEYYKHYLNNLSQTVPGGQWAYVVGLPNRVIAVNTADGNPIVVPADGKYVYRYYNRIGGGFYTVNKAAFLSDDWQVTDNVLVYGGLRWDKYVNKDVNGHTYLHMPSKSPRLGVSWDVHGDSTAKLGAQLGRYTISIPSTVSGGAANAVTRYEQYYTYTGIDPTTGVPSGLTPIGTHVDQAGVVPAPSDIAVSNIKAPMAWSADVYFQQQLSSHWVGMVKFQAVKYERTFDDTQLNPQIQAYARAHGYPDYTVDPNGPYTLFNPGNGVVVKRDFNGDGQLETLYIPASAVGFSKARHKYYNLYFDINHPESPDEPWYLDANYSWVHLFGNSDGYADLTNRTGDAAGEQAVWDYPSIMTGAAGDLSGDQKSGLDVNGYYRFKSGFRVGADFKAHTGGPLSCLGHLPDLNDPGYGYNTHYCGGKLVPQGSAARIPFFWQLNLQAGYDWQIDQWNRLSVDFQVQNVTNRHGVINRNQVYDNGYYNDGSLDLNPEYGFPTYQPPRTSTFVLRYTF